MSKVSSITQEQTDRILELKRLGLRNREIAQEMSLDPKKVSAILIENGIRTRAPAARKDAERTLTCPKCKRGGFPQDYLFCPYCTADIRSERDKLLDLIKRTQELFTPPHSTERDSKAAYTLTRVREYLEVHRDV